MKNANTELKVGKFYKHIHFNCLVYVKYMLDDKPYGYVLKVDKFCNKLLKDEQIYFPVHYMKEASKDLVEDFLDVFTNILLARMKDILMYNE